MLLGACSIIAPATIMVLNIIVVSTGHNHKDGAMISGTQHWRSLSERAAVVNSKCWRCTCVQVEGKQKPTVAELLQAIQSTLWNMWQQLHPGTR